MKYVNTFRNFEELIQDVLEDEHPSRQLWSNFWGDYIDDDEFIKEFKKYEKKYKFYKLLKSESGCIRQAKDIITIYIEFYEINHDYDFDEY